ncbi:hypothetical protein [Ktedonobacter sp. SOSP1-52]|uniref:hypothetical protein n=1 Tax=Ktedonobacter sp. SOSP1-52 TaxID=2778366 RepID=UPI0019159EBC|nr:hypothetical protein [Ktedonobacter sp. SOSP1-52]
MRCQPGQAITPASVTHRHESQARRPGDNVTPESLSHSAGAVVMWIHPSHRERDRARVTQDCPVSPNVSAK